VHFYLILLQATSNSKAAEQPSVSCLTAVITWAPLIALLAFLIVMVRRMGYFRKRGGYINRTQEHMDRVEQTLSKIEEHLRKLAERDAGDGPPPA